MVKNKFKPLNLYNLLIKNHYQLKNVILKRKLNPEIMNELENIREQE